jgi:hypothetical protein
MPRIINHENFSITLDRSYYPIRYEIVEWCYEQFGTVYEGKWDISEAFGHTTVYFIDEKDYNWFILKWA